MQVTDKVIDLISQYTNGSDGLNLQDRTIAQSSPEKNPETIDTRKLALNKFNLQAQNVYELA